VLTETNGIDYLLFNASTSARSCSRPVAILFFRKSSTEMNRSASQESAHTQTSRSIRVARVAVSGDRVTTDDHEPDVMFDEVTDKLFEIVVQIHRSTRGTLCGSLRPLQCVRIPVEIANLPLVSLLHPTASRQRPFRSPTRPNSTQLVPSPNSEHRSP
jgi:hypothetical protein